MPIEQKPIPFGPVQESGSEELAGASPAAWNVVVDAKGCVRRRPGIAAYSEAPSTAVDATGISGLHATTSGELYAVGNQPVMKEVYRIGGGSAAQLTSTTKLYGDRRPVFAETEALLAMAAGRDPAKIVRATQAVSLLGGGPPQASHVIANASRLLLNDLMTQKTWAYYSDVATGTASYSGHESWNGTGDSGNITAESRPDPLVALAENTNEVFLLGSTSVQVFAPDVNDVYAPATTREFGCSAPYSVIRDDQALAWLDDKRRFVRTDGRSFMVLSAPIARTLAGFTTVSDAFGYRVHTGYLDALVWTFPTEGRTFCYQKGSGWSQWGGWDESAANWTAFPVTAHALVFGADTNAVGLSSGKVARLDLDTQTDLGEPVVASVTSGFQNRGTANRKHCRAVRLALRRGFTSDTESPVAWLEWRDSLGAWGTPVPVRLGASGEYESVVVVRSLGVYRSREWRITFSGVEDFAVASVTEEYEVLSS